MGGELAWRSRRRWRQPVAASAEDFGPAAFFLITHAERLRVLQSEAGTFDVVAVEGGVEGGRGGLMKVLGGGLIGAGGR